MPLSKEDREEVSGLVRSTLGLKDDQTLEKLIEDQTNSTLNAYDRRTKKEREATAKSLSDITAKLDQLATGKGGADGDDGDGDDSGKGGEGDAGKGGKPENEAIARLEKANRDLLKKFEASERARQEQEAEAKKQAEKQADRDLRDAIRNGAIAKEVGIDPEAVDFVIAHLHGDRMARGEQSLVRRRENGNGYEMAFGEDKVTGDPIWKPLGEALKGWSQTPLGKRFLPPVPGGGTDTTVRGGGGGDGAAKTIRAEDLIGKSPAQVRELTKNAQVQTG